MRGAVPKAFGMPESLTLDVFLKAGIFACPEWTVAKVRMTD